MFPNDDGFKVGALALILLAFVLTAMIAGITVGAIATTRIWATHGYCQDTVQGSGSLVMVKCKR